MESMRTFILPVHGLQLSRKWRIGTVTFRPPGDLDIEVATRMGKAQTGSAQAQLDQMVAELAAQWSHSATVSTEASSDEVALTTIREALAVVRFLLRERVPVNPDIHKIGLPEEGVVSLRHAVTFSDRGWLGFSLNTVSAAVEMTIADREMKEWASDQRVTFIDATLTEDPENRSALGQRAITALQVLDNGFMATNPSIKALFVAMAVEVMFSAAADGLSTALPIARRVAHLLCPARCAVNNPECPFINGFKNMKAVVQHAEEHSQKGEGSWQCSTFLHVGCPNQLVPYIHKTPIFTARNEIAHEGVTSLTNREINNLRWRADRAVSAGLQWFAEHPEASVDDLDAEIEAALDRNTGEAD